MTEIHADDDMPALDRQGVTRSDVAAVITLAAANIWPIVKIEGPG